MIGFAAVLVAASVAGVSAADVRIDIDTGGRINVVTCGDAAVFATVSNLTDAALSVDGRIVARDYFGEEMSVPVKDSCPLRGAIRVQLPTVKKKGVWRVRGEFAGVGVKDEETSFARLDRRRPSSRREFGTFRFGIHFDALNYDAAVRTRAYEALAALGARLVRTDFKSFALVQPDGPDREDWSRHDRVLDELTERGFAVDMIISCPPDWARAPEVVARKRPGSPPDSWNRPALSGPYRDFCAKVSSRYRGRVDYYELGNELDIASPEYISADEAIEMYRAGYEGLKRGDPEARVIPCGFAVASSDHHMVKNKGFQERMMSVLQREGIAAAHPLHLHWDFKGFVWDMEKFFRWRRAQGVTLPWYPNETSFSGYGGGDDTAARYLWQKIVWARAHGAIDYVWYNILATGRDPKDGEQGYGLFSRDFHPRATAAAFAALTALLSDAEYGGALRDTIEDAVYRFASADKTIAVGWTPAVCRREIRVGDAASACRVDLMGNAEPLSVKDGKLSWTMGSVPSAIVIDGRVELALPSGTTVDSLPSLAVSDAPFDGRSADISLCRVDQVENLWAGNPATRDRLWKGRDDLSARIWLQRTDGRLRVCLEVEDDRATAGDRVEMSLSGTTVVLPVRRTTGNRSYYAHESEWPEGPVEFRVGDDDGAGMDAWLSTGKMELR